ncbi:MAG: hypothetical protein JRM90_07380 [Nitrososphaerota archaeon]|nr:hypothetical protein [Nitrososphaerota archaeon]
MPRPSAAAPAATQRGSSGSAPEITATRRRTTGQGTRGSEAWEGGRRGRDLLSSKKNSEVVLKLRSGQTFRGLLKEVGRDELVLEVRGMELVVFRQAVEVVQLLREPGGPS